MASENLAGILLALLSSICFAANRSFASRPLVKTNATTAIYLGLVVGLIILAFPLFAFGQEIDLAIIGTTALVIFLIVGVLHLGVGRTFSFTSVKNIGANQASLLIASQILYSLIFAVVLLGETISLVTGIGIASIVFGVLILEVKKSALKRGGKIKLGIISGLAAGAIFGFTPILIKIGLGLFHYYAAATFVAYAAAVIFYAIIIPPRKIVSETRSLPKYALVSYVIAGAAGAGAQLFRFGALSLTTVVFVVPILSAHPIFTFLMTRKLAKEFEVFHTRTVLAIVLIIAGTIVVSYSAGVLG
ncbi:MAG TPA: DMT family transporter [Nitrososphaerales archaeon]|nr:DMT family transporter [Nitrososphaerales archaeon]